MEVSPNHTAPIPRHEGSRAPAELMRQHPPRGRAVAGHIGVGDVSAEGTRAAATTSGRTIANARPASVIVLESAGSMSIGVILCNRGNVDRLRPEQGLSRRLEREVMVVPPPTVSSTARSPPRALTKPAGDSEAEADPGARMMIAKSAKRFEDRVLADRPIPGPLSMTRTRHFFQPVDDPWTRDDLTRLRTTRHCL